VSVELDPGHSRSTKADGSTGSPCSVSPSPPLLPTSGVDDSPSSSVVVSCCAVSPFRPLLRTLECSSVLDCKSSAAVCFRRAWTLTMMVLSLQPYRFRSHLCLYRCSSFDHRVGFPHLPRTSHLALQLVLVPRIHRRRLGHLRYFPNRQHLVMACPFAPPGSSLDRSSHLDLVHPRIPSMVHRQWQGRTSPRFLRSISLCR
jgi:hypothetical protein